MDRFVFPKSFYDTIKTFKSSHREAIYTAIFGYIFEDIEPTISSVDLQRVWMLMFPILSKAKKISNTMSRQSQENVKTISRDTNENVKTNSRASSFKEKDKEKEYKDKDNTPYNPPKVDKSAKASKFIKPTLEEVRAYIEEKGYHINPNDFINHYESNGWMVGKNHMKNWKASVSYWASQDKAKNPTKYIEPKKAIPDVSECPICHSDDITQSMDRFKCNSCNLVWDWNFEDERWEITL